MKRFNKYFIGALLLGVGALGLTSCDLDEYNPSNEGAEAVFATEQGIEGLVNNLYYEYRRYYFGRMDPVIFFEASTDIWSLRPGKYAYAPATTRYVGLQGTSNGLSGIWQRNYDCINTANSVLEYLPETKGISNEARADYEGEARFMRSYAYWWLVEFFGDIVMNTTGTDSPQFEVHRTDRKVIYDEVIIPDAEQATQLLPVQPYKGHVGRSTKKAAYALLARACLARAQYEAQGSAAQKAFYERAYNAAKYVMDHKADLGITLYKTYDEIWQAKNNKTNTEFLWVTTLSSIESLQPNPTAQGNNMLHAYWSPCLTDPTRAGLQVSFEYPVQPTEFTCMPTYYFLNLWQDWDARYDAIFQEDFPESDSRGYIWKTATINSYKGHPNLLDKKAEYGKTVLRFTRREAKEEEKVAAAAQGICLLGVNDSYETDNVNAMGGCKIQADITANYEAYPRFKKYRIWDGDANGTKLLSDGSSKNGYADVPVMRYAEMPLIAAEALIGMGRTADAAKVINDEIRNARVVKSGHDVKEAQVSEGDMTVEWILEERARELCGEWLRWFDLKRTGKLVSYVRGHNPAWDGIDMVSEHNNLWPIPNDFLDKLTNAEEFGQNPGYAPFVKSGN